MNWGKVKLIVYTQNWGLFPFEHINHIENLYHIECCWVSFHLYIKYHQQEEEEEEPILVSLGFTPKLLQRTTIFISYSSCIHS